MVLVALRAREHLGRGSYASRGERRAGVWRPHPRPHARWAAGAGHHAARHWRRAAAGHEDHRRRRERRGQAPRGAQAPRAGRGAEVLEARGRGHQPKHRGLDAGSLAEPQLGDLPSLHRRVVHRVGMAAGAAARAARVLARCVGAAAFLRRLATLSRGAALLAEGLLLQAAALQGLPLGACALRGEEHLFVAELLAQGRQFLFLLQQLLLGCNHELTLSSDALGELAGELQPNRVSGAAAQQLLLERGLEQV
mmetsp:Transcript_723/g.1803  ORF Transcript_723/g.1803 Transcript_723/m.1803 type:complete len:252 (+) Transcript_723:101-856(+)